MDAPFCKSRRPRRKTSWPCREDNTVRRYRSLFCAGLENKNTSEKLQGLETRKRGCGPLLLRCVADFRGCRMGVSVRHEIIPFSSITWSAVSSPFLTAASVECPSNSWTVTPRSSRLWLAGGPKSPVSLHPLAPHISVALAAF